ncbi:hypothetical protein D3C76_1598740 [compost metagenome]
MQASRYALPLELQRTMERARPFGHRQSRRCTPYILAGEDELLYLQRESVQMLGYRDGEA